MSWTQKEFENSVLALASIERRESQSAPCERCGLINGHRHPCTDMTKIETEACFVSADGSARETTVTQVLP